MERKWPRVDWLENHTVEYVSDFYQSFIVDHIVDWEELKNCPEACERLYSAFSMINLNFPNILAQKLQDIKDAEKRSPHPPKALNFAPRK